MIGCAFGVVVVTLVAGVMAVGRLLGRPGGAYRFGQADPLRRGQRPVVSCRRTTASRLRRSGPLLGGAVSSTWEPPEETSSCSTSGRRGAHPAEARLRPAGGSTSPSRARACASSASTSVTTKSMHRPSSRSSAHLPQCGGQGQLPLLAFRDTLPPSAIPSTLVIDREGRMAASVLDEITEASLRDLVDHDRRRESPAPPQADG